MIFLIYENIISLCREKNITIHRLEKECGLGNATVRGWVTSSPSVKLLKTVADYLNVTVDDLLTEPGKDGQ